MPDRLRTDPSAALDGLSSAERDSRIEQLLLTGLDHYFAGEYERAISAWTRVLFLDRGHARAKAYIDRARGAVAERQRESEELLHRGVAAFNRGETAAARRLLTSAVERGGPQEVALAFLERLDRLARPGAPVEAPVERHAARRRLRGRVEAGEAGRRRRSLVLPLLVVLAVALGGFYLQSSRERVEPLFLLLDWRGEAKVGAAASVEEPLPVPRSAEVDLARARMSFAGGRARDALRLVEAVRAGDPLRTEADRLREEIQRSLLATTIPDKTPQRMVPASTVPAHEQ